MIKQNIEERDFLDSHRKVSPLVQASDAILIDTTHLTQDEQLAKVLEIIKDRVK